MSTISIGLFGCGVVGSGVVQILHERAEQIEQETGYRLQLSKVCILHPEKQRPVDLSGIQVTTAAEEIVDNPDIDIIIEVIGGIEDALQILTRGLTAGKSVVTANKLLLAEHLPELRQLENCHGGRLLYGASVCGSVPILKVIEETLSIDTITSIRGVINGSTNFILGQLTKGVRWDKALAIAREEGFLEADPTLDISGADTGQKLSILAWHAFGCHVPPSQIPTTGITEISDTAFTVARNKNQRIKLVAEGTMTETGPRLSVKPTVLPSTDVLALVDNEVNVVEVACKGVGTQRFIGKGAGSVPTANAVVTDLLDILDKKRYRRQIPATVFS